MADLQMQKMIELQRECRSEIGIEKGAPLVPTRFILWLVDRVQKLEQCSVVRCKELLIPMQHKEYNAIGAEGNSDLKNTKANNRFKSLTHVLQMLEELPAL